MTSTDVTKADEQSRELAAYDFGDDAGKGVEHSSDDLLIPFVAILQSNSPQLDPEKGVSGAQQGMLFNTVTEEMVKGKDGLAFIPVTRQHVYVEWVPREKGGGYVGQYRKDDPVVQAAMDKSENKFGKLIMDNGNELIETIYLYVILVESGQPAIIAFTSTKIKVLKAFNTKLNFFQVPVAGGRKVTPPLFAHQCRLTTVKQKNKHGEFYNFAIAPLVDGDMAKSLLKREDSAYVAARDMAEIINSGKAKVDFGAERKAAGAGEDPSATSSGVDEDGEDIPF